MNQPNYKHFEDLRHIVEDIGMCATLHLLSQIMEDEAEIDEERMERLQQLSDLCRSVGVWDEVH